MRIVFLFILCVAATSIASDTTRPASIKATHALAIQLAKAKYENTVQRARAEYLNSVVTSDRKLIDDLDREITAAMNAKDLKTAEAYDQQKADAVTMLAIHQNVQDSAPHAKVISAAWIPAVGGGRGGNARGSRSIDVTAKLKNEIAKGHKNITADIATFGDPYPGYGKSLTITIEEDGQTKTITIAYGKQIPDEVFQTDSFPPDDPAAIP